MHEQQQIWLTSFEFFNILTLYGKRITPLHTKLLGSK